MPSSAAWGEAGSNTFEYRLVKRRREANYNTDPQCISLQHWLTWYQAGSDGQEAVGSIPGSDFLQVGLPILGSLDGKVPEEIGLKFPEMVASNQIEDLGCESFNK